MHQIVEDILAAQQREHEFDLYVQEEMQKLPPCEGINHPSGSYGHAPWAPAAYLLRYPCGFTVNTCAPWLDETLANYVFAICNGCDQQHLVAELTYTPLDVGWHR